MKTVADATASQWSIMTVALLMLWDWTGQTAVHAQSVNSPLVLCEDLRLRCTLNTGCSMAMENYLTKCTPVLLGNMTKCPEECHHALVMLLSTEDGKRMMDCTCRDSYCDDIKARVEVCRSMVMESSKEESPVPCELASWICSIDRACANAWGYYQLYCTTMVDGDSCSERCLNAVMILRRQEKAAKLNRCRCETLECLQNKERMVRLCFNGGGGRKNRRKHRPRMFDVDPDREDVEMMLADPDFRPADRRRFYDDSGNGGARPARGPPAGFLCALAALLVTAASFQ